MVQEGQQAPDFELPSTADRTVRLYDALEEGPAVIVFFRGPWCAFCVEQLRTFSALTYDLKRHLDASVLPIAGDSLPDLREMRDLHDFRLQLLSDADRSVTEEYSGIESNATHGRVPIPATYIVDEEGIVRYRQVSERPDERTFAAYVRAFIRDDYTDRYPGTYPDPYTR